MTYQEFLVRFGRDPFPSTDNDDEQMAWKDYSAGSFHQMFNDLAEYVADRPYINISERYGDAVIVNLSDYMAFDSRSEFEQREDGIYRVVADWWDKDNRCQTKEWEQVAVLREDFETEVDD